MFGLLQLTGLVANSDPELRTDMPGSVGEFQQNHQSPPHQRRGFRALVRGPEQLGEVARVSGHMRTVGCSAPKAFSLIDSARRCNGSASACRCSMVIVWHLPILPLNEMTVEEKVQTMEAIWETLCLNPQAVESPDDRRGLLVEKREPCSSARRDAKVCNSKASQPVPGTTTAASRAPGIFGFLQRRLMRLGHG